MKYLNKETTEITIELDVWQTWQKEVTIKESFVEREHVANDNSYSHLIPEGVELGEYKVKSHETDSNSDSLFSDMCYIVASTLDSVHDSSGTRFNGAGGGKYNGIYSGVKYYRFDSPTEIDNLLKAYVNAGQGEGVNGVFMVPKWLAPCDSNIGAINQTAGAKSYDISIEKNYNNLDGYVPKNKKLFCYPFNYLMVSNNNGANAIYRYENFDASKCTFKVNGAICPGCSIRMTPKAYKGTSEYDEESINLGKFPICNWTTDMYTNWMVKNSASIRNTLDETIATGVAGTIGGIVSLDLDKGFTSATSAYFGVKGVMAELEKQRLTPPQANGNLNCGDVITSTGKNTFHFYKMTIKKEAAQRIDKYFDMYGYQVNTLKIPEMTSRPCWNFVKTIGVNIDGAIPQNHLAKIREMFDSGVTFWKAFDIVENYSLDNRIV